MKDFENQNLKEENIEEEQRQRNGDDRKPKNQIGSNFFIKYEDIRIQFS